MTISEAITLRFHNVDIEYQVVAYAMNKNPLSLAPIKKEWFSVTPLSNIAAIIKSIKVTLTGSAILQELQNRRVATEVDLDIYQECLNKIDEQNVSHLTNKSVLILIRQLCDLYESKKLLLGTAKLLTDLKSFDLPRAKEKLRELSKVESVSDDRSGDWVGDFKSRVQIIKTRMVEARDEESNVGIKTGIPRFDAITGGLMIGEFGVIMGKPSVGKTATLVNFAMDAYLQGFNVHYCDGENTKSIIQFRMDSKEAAIPFGLFRTGKLKREHWERWKRVIAKHKSSNDNFLEVTTFPRRFTVDTIEERSNIIQDRHGKAIDLFVIDSLNIMDSVESRRGRGEWTDQANVAWEVKGFINDFNGGVRGWTASQVVDISKENLGYWGY